MWTMTEHSRVLHSSRGPEIMHPTLTSIIRVSTVKTLGRGCHYHQKCARGLVWLTQPSGKMAEGQGPFGTGDNIVRPKNESIALLSCERVKH